MAPPYPQPAAAASDRPPDVSFRVDRRVNRAGPRAAYSAFRFSTTARSLSGSGLGRRVSAST